MELSKYINLRNKNKRRYLLMASVDMKELQEGMKKLEKGYLQ